MTSEPEHHTSGGLELAIALAAAGFVDAFVYRRVAPVFVANMSGNLVHLGMATGDGDGAAMGAAVVALAGFLLGAALSTAHLDSIVRSGRRPHSAWLLRVEAALLVALPVSIVAAGVHRSASPEPIDALVFVIGSTAMGIQAVALRRVGQIAISTTFGTGAVVRLGEKLALAARRAARPGAVRRRRTIAVLGAVLVAYVAGAALAATLGTSPWLLSIPAAVPAVGSWVVGSRAVADESVPGPASNRA